MGNIEIAAYKVLGNSCSVQRGTGGLGLVNAVYKGGQGKPSAVVNRAGVTSEQTTKVWA